MGRKEDNIKKAETLVHRKEQIRNIGTAAHIDHGKCLDGKSRILFEARWVRASELFERFAREPLSRKTPDEEVHDLRNLNLSITCLDQRTQKFVQGKLTHAWKLKTSKPLIRVTLLSRESIATTPEHRFLVWRDVGLHEVAAGELRMDDMIVVRTSRSLREILRRTLDRTWIPVSGSGSRSVAVQAQRINLINGDLAALPVTEIGYETAEYVYDFTVEPHHNFVAEGIVVHNTTLSDSLIAGAGMISQDLAGTQLFMDFDEQEQARGITINAAIASMVHEHEGHEFLINLIDTPGHVDFGGDVTRAMRAIDGVIILVDAVEGIMPQTETVIRQALKERVKPVLFINKVDRLVNELKISPEQMQQRFTKIITEVNARIRKLLPDDLKDMWSLNVETGTVAFGSAFHKWALSVPYMKRSSITFRDVYKHCQEGTMKELAKKAPLHSVVLSMVIRHLPNPLDAQRIRIPIVWKGDLESRVGKAMMVVDENGPVGFMVTKIIVDPQAGEVAAGRLFSGKIRRGQELWVIGMPKPQRAQTVAMIVGPDRIPVEEIDAGNVVAVVGLRDAIAGSSVSDDKDMQPFEKIVHYSDPVVTVAIEAKSTADLPKLVEVLRLIAKADPSIQVEINQETGEHLISGMGELHLEITIYRVQNEHKVPVSTSTPIVVYRECVARPGGPFEGKSPNKHNRFYMEVEALEPGVLAAIRAGEIASGQRIKDAKALQKKLEELGMPRDDAKNVVWIQDTNMLIDGTRGIQYLHETMELIKEAYIEAMNRGPLAAEKGMAIKVRLVDAKLHEDSVHRGPAQVIPAARSAIYGAMCQGGRILLEPVQKVFINVPQDYMGSAIGDVQSRRGVIEDITQEGEATIIQAKAPVAEMFGFASAIRSATQGRALWSTENSGYEPVPNQLQGEVVRGIRTRKGLPPEPYDESYYAA